MFSTGGFILSALLAANAVHASLPPQLALNPTTTTAPATGNIPYTLPSERVFLLNVPPSYTHGEPAPLVLSFHGASGFSARQQIITELSDPDLRIAGRPFLTAYAQGVNNTAWRPKMHHIWKGAPYENKTVDDIAYVYDMIAAIAATYTIDTTRIYACGKSNGGGFTALLACRPDTSATIAAFAPVAPALYEGTGAFHGCAPSRPAPMLHVHGVEDAITPFYGRKPEQGSFGPEPDVRVWRREWAERNGCAREGLRYPGEVMQPHRVTEVHPGVWEELWECPGAEVSALTVEGLGHSWPSTAGWDRAGRPNHMANFNLTSQHLVQFFSRHSLEK